MPKNKCLQRVSPPSIINICTFLWLKHEMLKYKKILKSAKQEELLNDPVCALE